LLLYFYLSISFSSAHWLGCVNLILSMLRVNEADRISLAKMRFHPWVNEGHDEPPPCFLAVPEPVSEIGNLHFCFPFLDFLACIIYCLVCTYQ
jgi:hypothetical protein